MPTATGPQAGAPELLELLEPLELELELDEELLDELLPELPMIVPDELVLGSLGPLLLLEHAMTMVPRRPAEATRSVRFIKVCSVCHAVGKTTRARAMFALWRTFAWIAEAPSRRGEDECGSGSGSGGEEWGVGSGEWEREWGAIRAWWLRPIRLARRARGTGARRRAL